MLTFRGWRETMLTEKEWKVDFSTQTLFCTFVFEIISVVILHKYKILSQEAIPQTWMQMKQMNLPVYNVNSLTTQRGTSANALRPQHWLSVPDGI